MRQAFCCLLCLLAVAALAASLPPGVKCLYDLPYAYAGGSTLLLDLYLPVKAE